MLRAVVLFVAVSATTAFAEKVDRDLQSGIDAFRLGKYDDARAALDRARANDPKAAAPHRYLAAVARAQRRWEDCIDSARRALALEPASSEVADTRALHESCRVGAGRAPAGELGDAAAIAVTSAVPGATVRVGGLVYGGTPIAPRPITVGRLAVVVDKPGYKHFEVAVDTMAGIVTDVRVDLEPGVDAEALPAPRTGSLLVRLPDTQDAQLYVDGAVTPIPPNGRVAAPPGVRVVELRQSGKEPWRRRIVVTADHDTVVAPTFSDGGPRASRRRLGLVAGGTGIGLVAFAIASFQISRSATNEANDILRVEIGRQPGQTTPPIRTRADFEAARDKANTWATISNIAYAGGFAAGGFGLYLLLANRADADAPPFAFTPVHGGGMLARVVTW